MKNMDYDRNLFKTVVVDFDGTICPNMFPDFPPPFPDAKASLETLKRMGFEIIIHTTRTASYWLYYADLPEVPRLEKQIEKLKEYLDKYEIPYDNIWLQDKPLFKYYIDDNAIRIENGNWAKVINFIKENETIKG